MPSEVTKSKAKVRADPADVTANAFEVTVEPSVPPYPPTLPVTPPSVDIQLTLEYGQGIATTPSVSNDTPELPIVVHPAILAKT